MMHSNLSNKKSFFKTFACFLILVSLSSTYLLTNFEKEKSLIELQAKDIISLNRDKIFNYLQQVETKIIFWQRKIEKLDHFTPEKFNQEAQAFLSLSPSVLAFNFVSSESIITNVFPFESNRKALGKNLKKHPDEELRRLFAGDGLDKNALTFTSPVDIHQGGKAVIFYAPVSFRNHSQGWLNIVVRIDKVFLKFLSSKDSQYSNISIYDKQTGRYLFGKENDSKEETTINKTTIFNSREIVFSNNIGHHLSNAKKKYITLSFFIMAFIFLVSLLLFNFFKNLEETQNNLVSVKNERNLLSMLFHDLVNPLSIVLIYMEELKEKYPQTESIPRVLARIKQMVEIITSIKHLDFLNRNINNLEESKINFKDIFENLLVINQDLIEKKGLKVVIENEENVVLVKKIPIELFKNEIIQNLLNNCLKFAFDNSEVKIKITKEKIVFINKSKAIDKFVLKNLNESKPTQSREVAIQSNGHGLGFFIARILATRFDLKLSIEQDPSKQEVQTILIF